MKYYKLIKTYPSIPKEVSVGVIVEFNPLYTVVKMLKADKFILVNESAFIDYVLKEGELLHKEYWVEVEKPIKKVSKKSYTVEEIFEIAVREGIDIKTNQLYLLR